MGVEPTCQPWEGRILPMNYTRTQRGRAFYGAIIADLPKKATSFFSHVPIFFPVKEFPPGCIDFAGALW